jgi:glycosyltransferase involved in cell wall biosynthesis
MLKASVIIPVRNRSAILVESLRTIARQSCRAADYEVVVIDDGSTDDVAERLHGNRYPFTVIYDRIEPIAKFCPARPRNRGLSLARGDIAILLDVDMICSPQLVGRHIAAHRDEERPKAVIGYTYGFPADPVERTPEVMKPPAPHLLLKALPDLLKRDNRRWRDSREDIYVSSADLVDYPMPWQVFWTNNVSIPRKLALDIGGFDEEFVGWGIEDIEFAFRLFQRGVSFALCRDAWGIHYPHPNDHQDRRPIEMEQNCRRLIRKHPNFMLEVSTWAWEAASPMWTALEGLRLDPPRFDQHVSATTSAFLGRLRDQVFAPGPILWCGDAPNALTAVVDPAAYCWPFDNGTGDACPDRLSLLGLRTPWEDAAFAGAFVTDYWRYVPTAVLSRMVQELVRTARSIVLLYSETMRDVAGSMRLRTRQDCKAALMALPGNFLCEEHVGSGITAFLVYPSPRGMGSVLRGGRRQC